MKFLCVACDEPMKLDTAEGPDEGGSMRVLYECPECFTQMAMLTNPMETQLVTSLGVKIGPGGEKQEGKCPFAGMMGDASGATAPKLETVVWTEGALERLSNIPEFVRPMARQGIEQFAKEGGHAVVDEAVLDEARGRFGM